ncbi:MAG: ATP-binding protein [Methyloprofundus sp.]|nr:ATP-binding protein [Methyloprofundus sp.]
MMYSLNRLILIDSYKEGELQEVRLDGHTNLNGVNGAGKTTLLRLIPLFYGERPGRLVPKSRVTDSFVKHYLPRESSYIIFEYQRHEQTCMVAIYASTNDEGLCYRFIDKAFEPEDFIEQHDDGGKYPVSCRHLKAHLVTRQVQHSNQVTACSDYRTIMQNLPHNKGQEMRQLIARYSFCQGSLGQRLKDIEKIITGMFMRSTDFADLREMLVNCIDENRESIALELQMETLDNWYKEYRAYQQVEQERPKIELLNQVETVLLHTEQGLGELFLRLQKLLVQSEQTEQEQRQARAVCDKQLEQVQKAWEEEELALKSALATTKAELAQLQRQKTQLEKEKAAWEAQDIAGKKQLYSRLESIKTALDSGRDNLSQLMADVQDIEAEFRRLQAEKERYFAAQIHGFELQKQQQQQTLSEQKAQATAEMTERKETLRDASEQQQEQTRQSTLNLSEQLGALNSQITQVQADPVLIADRETKLELHDAYLLQKQEAEANEQAVEEEIREHKAAVDVVFQKKRQHAEEKQTLQAKIDAVEAQINADASTLLGFLRDYKTDWGTSIAKVIKPELLLRDDLEPELLSEQAGLYGIALQLGGIEADRTVDEQKLRDVLQDLREQMQLHIFEQANAEEELQQLTKVDASLQKKQKQMLLEKGQAHNHLQRVKEELDSLKRQIVRSKKEREQQLKQQRTEVNEQITQNNLQLTALQQQLKEDIRLLTQALAEKIAEFTQQAEHERAIADQEINRLKEQKANELAELKQQRLQSMRERKVDTATLTALELKVSALKQELMVAENAQQLVSQYQRWLEVEWLRYDAIQTELVTCATTEQQQNQQYAALYATYQQQRKALDERLEQIKNSIKKYDKEVGTLKKVIEDLAPYPKKIPEQVSFDSSHHLNLLQGHFKILSAKHKTQRKELTDLVRHLKRVLAAIPNTRPYSYYSAVNTELGIDSDEMQWLPAIQEWFGSSADDTRRWLVMQAQTFGSAIRNYQQALQRFDRGIDSLSRRLAANIDKNISFEKIESIQGRLTSKVKTLGYWEQIVKFTDQYDEWSRHTDGQLPADDFAEIVRRIAEQLQSKNKVEMKLVNLLELEIIVTENGRHKRATHAEELRQISSHGLSYLILCVFFIALVNMIRKDQPVRFIWPMDELKELHQLNIEMLIELLTKNNITLLSAFPDPDPEILGFFKNRYQVHGFRELIEMDMDADYMASLEALAFEVELPETKAEVIVENADV